MVEQELGELFKAPGSEVVRHDDKKLNIAKLDLVFDNEFLIKKLKERGLALYDKDRKLVESIELEIESKKE